MSLLCLLHEKNANMVNANNICECSFILFSLLKFLAEDNISHTAHAASSTQHTILVILLMPNHSLYPKCKLYLIGISKKWIRTKTVAERIPKRIGALQLFEVSFFGDFFLTFWLSSLWTSSNLCPQCLQNFASCGLLV